MKYEEVLEIIERVRNGEKAEEIIDFEQPTRSGEITPSQALEVVNEALICKTCKKPIVDKGQVFVCKECAEKSREQFYQTDIGKTLKERNDNGWSWILGLILIAGIFGWNGDKDKKE